MKPDDRRDRRDQRQQEAAAARKGGAGKKPAAASGGGSGKGKKAPGRPMWQTVLIGLALVAGAFGIAVVLTGEGAEEAVETAPVELSGDPLAPIPQAGPDAAVGAPAPQATGQDFEGEEVELLNDDGGTIIVLLAHWCPVCQREVPVIVDHLGGGALPDDVEVVGVPTSTDRSQGNYPPSAWLEAEDWEFEVMVDSSEGEIGQYYGLQSFPSFIAVGPDGNVQARAVGELSPEGLDELVAAAQG